MIPSGSFIHRPIVQVAACTEQIRPLRSRFGNDAGTSIHVITFLLFSVIVFQASSPGALRGLREARPAG